jgi:hypothetical protein
MECNWAPFKGVSHSHIEDVNLKTSVDCLSHCSGGWLEAAWYPGRGSLCFLLLPSVSATGRHENCFKETNCSHLISIGIHWPSCCGRRAEELLSEGGFISHLLLSVCEVRFSCLPQRLYTSRISCWRVSGISRLIRLMRAPCLFVCVCVWSLRTNIRPTYGTQILEYHDNRTTICTRFGVKSVPLALLLRHPFASFQYAMGVPGVTDTLSLPCRRSMALCGILCGWLVPRSAACHLCWRPVEVQSLSSHPHVGQ